MVVAISFAILKTLSIEKGRAVPYRDLVTILRLASDDTKQNPGPPSQKLYSNVHTL